MCLGLQRALENLPVHWDWFRFDFVAGCNIETSYTELTLGHQNSEDLPVKIFRYIVYQIYKVIMYLAARVVKGSSLRVRCGLVPTCLRQNSHSEQRAWSTLYIIRFLNSSESYRDSLVDWPTDLEECSEIFRCQEYPPGLTPRVS